MDQETVKKALEAGIIDDEQAQAIDALASNPHDNEAPRFVRSFGDFFIAVGVMIVWMASSWSVERPTGGLMAIGLFLLMAEFLIANKRLVLPGMLINLAVIQFVFDLSSAYFPAPALSAALAAVAALIFYLRYRLPFSMMVFVLCVVASGFFTLESMGFSKEVYFYGLAVMGALVFLLAMGFDRRDRLRSNRISDTAFWLHLVAAPMVGHGVMWSYFSNAGFGSWMPLFFYLILFAVALFVDRRAMVLSGLIYVIATLLYKSVEEGLLGVENLAALVIGIGGLSIALGVYWYPLRQRVFGRFADSRLASWVPPFSQ